MTFGTGFYDRSTTKTARLIALPRHNQMYIIKCKKTKDYVRVIRFQPQLSSTWRWWVYREEPSHLDCAADGGKAAPPFLSLNLTL